MIMDGYTATLVTSGWAGGLMFPVVGGPLFHFVPLIASALLAVIHCIDFSRCWWSSFHFVAFGHFNNLFTLGRDFLSVQLIRKLKELKKERRFYY